MASMMRNAKSVPAMGETTMAIRIFEIPPHWSGWNPRAATTAPIRPPMIAWEDEAGMP